MPPEYKSDFEIVLAKPRDLIDFHPFKRTLRQIPKQRSIQMNPIAIKTIGFTGDKIVKIEIAKSVKLVFIVHLIHVKFCENLICIEEKNRPSEQN